MLQNSTGTIPSAIDWELRLESEDAERELAQLQGSNPDVVLAMDYVSGAMSPEEHAAFEARLAVDPTLQSVVFPLLQLMEAMRDRHDRAVEEGEPAAQRALQRLRQRMMQEGADDPDDARADGATPGSGEEHRPSDTAAERGRRLVRSAVRVARVLGLLLISIFILSLFGPWGPFTPSWRVMRDEVALDGRLTLSHDVDLLIIGRYFVAEHAAGLLDAREWFDAVSEVYVDAGFLTVTTSSRGQRELRLDTPQLRIQSKGGAVYRVEREHVCEVKVTAQSGALLVTSRMAPPAPSTVVQAGQSIRMGCDGKLGHPGSAPSVFDASSGQSPSGNGGTP